MTPSRAAISAQECPAFRGPVTVTVGYERRMLQYTKRMLQYTKGALPGLSGSLRRHLYRQAERLATCIQDPGATWTGLSWR